MTQELVATSTLLPPRDDLTGARLRLFEAALVLFGDRGYHAVSVRDLMNELGQQPGALYFHVQSKEDLLFELMRIGIEVHRDRIKAALLDAGRDPVDQVRAITEAHVRAHLEFPALARVSSRELRSLSAEHLERLAATRAETQQAFVDVIERGVRLGAFTVREPRLAMYAIGGMGVRAAEWWTPDDPHTIDEVARSYADFAVKVVS